MSHSRLLRRPEVMKRTGLSKSTLYDLMAKNNFPRQVMLTERCVGWDEDEIQDWIVSKLEKRNQTLNIKEG